MMLPYTAGVRTLGVSAGGAANDLPDLLGAVQSEGPFAGGEDVQDCAQDPLQLWQGLHW